ncbi:MAG: head-tail adaptor protein [Pseudomonadota bacterium]
MKIRADRQASFYRKVVTTDATFGTEVVTYEPVVAQAGSPVIAERWRVEFQDVMPSRSEAVKQGMAIASDRGRLRMRWRGDLDSTMRVTLHGESDKTYQIVGGPAEIGGRKQYVEMVLERYSSE